MNEMIQAIHQANPFPWNHVAWPSGKIQVMDSEGKEVPIFTMLDFLQITTQEQLAKESA